jgi:hypothetical protein
MKHLRIKPFDIVNDIYLLQEKKKFLFIPYWATIGVGSKENTEAVLEELERKGLVKLLEVMIQDTETQIERLK